MSGCVISGSTDAGINVWSNGLEVCENVVVSGNSLYNPDTGIKVGVQNGGIVKNCTIIGNNVEYALKRGIVIQNVSNVLISSNMIYNSGRGDDIFNAGIFLENSFYNIIIGNKCYDDQVVKTQLYGFREYGTSDYNIVVNNDFRNNATGDTYILGTNTFVQQIKNNRFEFNKEVYTDGVVTSHGMNVSGSIKVNNSIYINFAGPDGDQYIYFYDGGSPTGRYIKWDNTYNRFDFNADIICAYIYPDYMQINNADPALQLRNSGYDTARIRFLSNEKAAYLTFNNLTHRFELDHGFSVDGNLTNNGDIQCSGSIIRNKYINLPIAGAILPDGTAYNLPASIERQKASGSYGINPHYMAANFDDTQEESIQWSFPMPADYASSPVITIKFKALASSGSVQFGIGVAAISNDEDILSKNFNTEDSAYTTVPGTIGQIQDLVITLTDTDSLTAGDFVILYLKRDALALHDSLVGDCSVVSVILKYST